MLHLHTKRFPTLVIFGALGKQAIDEVLGASFTD